MTVKQAIKILESHNNWRRKLMDKTIHDLRFTTPNRPKVLERITVPQGDWQQLTFDEETARKIIQCIALHKYWNETTPAYLEYLHKTALESLRSLIQANVTTFNSYGEVSPLTEGSLYWGSSRESAEKEWQKAEKSTFHNPHYFFKLK